MSRASSIERLPPEIRELIGALRRDGRTIDEIMAKLGELSVDVSRAAMGRHVKQIDAMAAEMTRQKIVAEALVARFPDAAENRTARLNIHIAQGMLMKLLVSEDGQLVTLEPAEAMMVSKAIQNLVSAAKADTERDDRVAAAAERRAKAAAVAIVERVTNAGGMSAGTAASIKTEILGIEA